MSTLRLYEIADTYLAPSRTWPTSKTCQSRRSQTRWRACRASSRRRPSAPAEYVRSLEAEASAIEEARKGMERRQRSLTRHAERLREYVKNHMERTGLPKLKNHYLTLRVQNNPPSVVVDDEKSIPDEYKRTETVTTLLRAEIARALKADEEVPGSHLQRSTRLVIQ